nr:hypothetical protein [uncultured Cohaesibacter sp.]
MIRVTQLVLSVFSSCSMIFISVDAGYCLTKEQLARFDEDGDGNVDAGKETVFFRHLANETLAKYDGEGNLNGKFDADEVERMNADVRKVDTEPESADIRLRLQEGVPVPVNTVYEKVEVISGTDIKYRFYLRQKRADIGISGDPLESLDGASFSYAEDIESDQTAVSVEGAAGILFRKTRVDFPDNYRPGDFALTAYAIGPFVEAKGTIDTDDTRLTGGVIGQAEFFGGPLFDLQLLSAAPYFQTDFDGVARIYGGALTWQPFKSEFALGAYRRLPGGFDFTWLFNGEAEYKYIDNPGTTGFAANSDNFWLGLDASARLLPLADQLDGRLFLAGSFAYYHDFESKTDAALTTAKVGYNLDKDKNTAIEFVYTNGRDHNTLKDDESYKATFTLKY